MTDEPEVYEPVVPLVGDTRVVGRRAVQFAVDVLIVQVVSVALGAGVALGLNALLRQAFLALLVGVLLWLWVSLLGWLLVAVWWPFVDGGRTPGMRWCGLRVVTLAGDRPRLAAHVVRCAATLIDGFPFGFVGLVVMANSARQQRIGDLLAGTLVVRDRQSSTWSTSSAR